MKGLCGPYQKPAKIMFSFFILPLYGSSFMERKNGHKENLEDLNTGTPSVFQVKDMLYGYLRERGSLFSDSLL